MLCSTVIACSFHQSFVFLKLVAKARAILANRPDLVGTVPIWRPKPDVPPDDPKKPIRPVLSRSTPKNTIFRPRLHEDDVKTKRNVCG